MNKAAAGPLTEGYERMLMQAENAPLLASMNAGGIDGQPPALNGMRHESPERGYDTAGFGHKMTKEEHNSGFVNGKRLEEFKPVDLMNMFRKDQTRIMIGLKKGLRGMGVDHSKWSTRKIEAAFDIHYNVKKGIASYPKFVAALDANDWKTAQAESARSYTVDGEKKNLQGRADLWNAQFMGTNAATGYGGAAADKETAGVMDEQRKQRVNAATPLRAPSMEEVKQEAAIAEAQNIQPQEQAGADGGFLQAAQQQDGVLVDTPKPDIDLGGMMSKEYELPTGGDKGMLSTLPAQLKA